MRDLVLFLVKLVLPVLLLQGLAVMDAPFGNCQIPPALRLHKGGWGREGLRDWQLLLVWEGLARVLLDPLLHVSGAGPLKLGWLWGWLQRGHRFLLV